jgi:uncharacterized protein (DUF697 family)
MTERELGALQIVNRHSLYAGGIGLIPIPLVDVAGTMAVQVHLVSELSKHYGVPFTENRVKGFVTGLVGGLAPMPLATGLVGPIVRSLPIIGGVLGAFALPAVAGAITFAIGKVFIQHFESGGTFLDFNPDKVRDYFTQEYNKARGGAA